MQTETKAFKVKEFGQFSAVKKCCAATENETGFRDAFRVDVVVCPSTANGDRVFLNWSSI